MRAFHGFVNLVKEYPMNNIGIGAQAIVAVLLAVPAWGQGSNAPASTTQEGKSGLDAIKH